MRKMSQSVKGFALYTRWSKFDDKYYVKIFPILTCACNTRTGLKMDRPMRVTGKIIFWTLSNIDILSQ